MSTKTRFNGVEAPGLSGPRRIARRNRRPLEDLHEAQPLVLPRGWLICLHLTREYRLAEGVTVWIRVDLLSDVAGGHQFFSSNERARVRMFVCLPSVVKGEVEKPRTRRALARITRALLRRGYQRHPGRPPERRFAKPVKSAEEINTAAAELDVVLGRKRRVVTAGSSRRIRGVS